LRRLDTANIESWSIQDNLQVGDVVYGDRANGFTSVPARLLGAERLQVSANSRTLQTDTAEFTARENIFVYIGLDERRNADSLSWLNGWQRVNMKVGATDQTAPTGPGITYNLLRTPLAAGQSIRLGTNGPSGSVIMYTVFFTSAADYCTQCQGSPCVCLRTVTFIIDGTPIPRQVTNGTAATAPNISRAGFVLSWDNSFDNVTEDTVVTAKWLRIGAVSTGGTGNVTSADVTYLARYIIGHSGFTLADNRIGNLAGYDRPPKMADVTLLARLMVGYKQEDLISETKP
jgi:hypothetical protein